MPVGVEGGGAAWPNDELPAGVVFWRQRYLRGNGGKEHSAKPEGFMDLVERVSPEPRLEMFARRARLAGWDYWGDQSLGTAELPGAAA